MQLHKHDVVRAATAILSSYGIADLTMRRLARDLGISPGALYWHFANKQQLLGAVADQVLSPVCADPGLTADPDWRRRIVVVCTRLRTALLSYTDGAELVSASFAAGQSGAARQVLGLVGDAAAEAGLDAEHAALAARTVLYYVLGATTDEQSRRQWDTTAEAPTAPVGSRSFEFGLALVIDGLAARAAPSAADRMLDTLVAVPPA